MSFVFYIGTGDAQFRLFGLRLLEVDGDCGAGVFELLILERLA